MLIVETGVGVPNADSLASVAFISEYHAARGNTVWATLNLEKQEQLARKATDYLRITYHGAWIGSAAFNINNLPWPRLPIEARHFGLFQLGVPVEVKQAVAELALIANTVSLFPNPTSTRGKKRVKIGPIEVEYDASANSQGKFVASSLMLIPYLKPVTVSGMARLIRA